MRNLILFLFAIFIVGCNLTDKNVSEKSIFSLSKESYDFYWLFGDTLVLFHQDEKCGEWGGDIERIEIFHKTEKIFGYYTKESFDCDNLATEYYGNPTSTIQKSKEIELTTQQIKLLKKAILDLIEYKLNQSSKNVVSNSGVVNKVQVKGNNDESFKIFIRDYPSFNWNTFHKLKNEILK